MFTTHAVQSTFASFQFALRAFAQAAAMGGGFAPQALLEMVENWDYTSELLKAVVQSANDRAQTRHDSLPHSFSDCNPKDCTSCNGYGPSMLETWWDLTAYRSNGERVRVGTQRGARWITSSNTAVTLQKGVNGSWIVRIAGCDQDSVIRRGIVLAEHNPVFSGPWTEEERDCLLAQEVPASYGR